MPYFLRGVASLELEFVNSVQVLEQNRIMNVSFAIIIHITKNTYSYIYCIYIYSSFKWYNCILEEVLTTYLTSPLLKINQKNIF